MNLKRFSPVVRASDKAYAMANAISARQAQETQDGFKAMREGERIRKRKIERERMLLALLTRMPYYLTRKGEYPWTD